MQFLKTLLLPEVHEPHPFVFFKVIKEEENPFPDNMPMKKVYVTRKDHYSPYIAMVGEFTVLYDKLIFLIHSDKQETYYDVTTDNHYIMEKDEIDCVLNTNLEIGDHAENELIQLMKDPSIKKKIPQELKDSPRFKRKIDVERTKGRIKSTNRTGTINHPKLSDLEQKLINDMLDVNTDPHAARREQTRRIIPELISEPTPEPEPAPKCKGSNCSISGGKRKRNRTRKNKKKMYGRL